MKRRLPAEGVARRRPHLHGQGEREQSAKLTEEDEDDYMSFRIEEEDRRLGFGERRRRAEGTVMPVAKRMREAVGAGLERSLGTENKGFWMLKAMGYKEGEGIGKRRQGRPTPLVAEGLLEPRKRAGIGIVEAQRRAKAATQAAKAATEIARHRDFRVSRRQAALELATARAANRAKLAVCDLDERAGIQRHGLWPSAEDSSNSAGVTSDDLGSRGGDPAENMSLEQQPPLSQLKAAVAYLRDVHQYCLSTGGKLDNECPTLEDEIAGLLEDAAG